ncbi:MAG: HD domain-containing protein [Patescibacteria group bacterium]
MKNPKEIDYIFTKLNENGHEAFLVGGCVRDLLLGRQPKDWDIATNALPEKVQEIFPDSVYENKFGTVAVKTASADSALKIIEVTTYRWEGAYKDKRHPDKVQFAKTIEDDLSRRDFTINAIALKDLLTVDPFNGREDLKNKIIRTVSNPDERFNEDALRLMRAVRIAAELGFVIEQKTAEAIKNNSVLLEAIAKERIRDEFIKLIMADRAIDGIRQMLDLGLLKYVLPELLEGVDVGQNKHHIYTVFEHNIRALDYAVSKNYSLEVRLASLLHDIGKPRTKKGDGPDSTFYNHDVVGAKMTATILDRLHFSKKIVEKVAHLVRCHLFYYNVGEVSEAGVRRFLRKVGPEHVDDLIRVREADRIGSGVPKAVPYKLRHLLFMIEKVKADPIDTRMLNIDGNDVMKLGDLQPGPKVGQILAVLLEEILDDPNKNSDDFLKNRIGELNKLDDNKLKEMAGMAKKRKEEFEGGLEEEIKKKYYV